MDQQVINNIKGLGIDMIREAKSGHPGITLGAAPIIYTLFSNHLNINTNDQNWVNRDRFVLSAGHGSALLYATLFMAGYDISLDDLKSFRKAGSKTPGHPELGITPGVEVSTGPLGEGFATAVGIALGEKILHNKFVIKSQKNFEPTHHLIDYKVYVLCSDGDLMEGISYEAASFAGNLNLDNLIVLYDCNNVSLDGETSLSFTENISERFKSMGWHIENVKNGNDIEDINKAIKESKNSGKPSLIEIHTIIGNGSLNQGTNMVHGGTLEEEDFNQLKNRLGLPEEKFYVNEQAKKYFIEKIVKHSAPNYNKWAENYRLFGNNYEDYGFLVNHNISFDLTKFMWNFENGSSNELRETNKEVMIEIANNVKNFIGGSADLASSTKAYLNKYYDVTRNHMDGRNIYFGVRENSMGAMTNGLYLSGFRPFCSTFLSFSDYLKPSIRLSALMKLPVIYIFTHDSIKIGQDGPTHQPIEQLAMLRSTPNLNVYRPADPHELVGCWNEILHNKETPSALIISRDETPLLETTSMDKVKYGAYVVKQEKQNLNAVIIATGSELYTALKISDDLEKQFGYQIRVVSMPCQETFLKMSKEYYEEILPVGCKRFVIEASSSFGWHRFVYRSDYLITIDQFGISGTKEEVERYCKFNYDEIKSRILKLLN